MYFPTQIIILCHDLCGRWQNPYPEEWKTGIIRYSVSPRSSDIAIEWFVPVLEVNGLWLFKKSCLEGVLLLLSCLGFFSLILCSSFCVSNLLQGCCPQPLGDLMNHTRFQLFLHSGSSSCCDVWPFIQTQYGYNLTPGFLFKLPLLLPFSIPLFSCHSSPWAKCQIWTQSCLYTSGLCSFFSS